MKVSRRALAGACIALACVTAQAQTYPSKPIRLINPLGTGGTAEVLARTLAKGISDNIGQTVVVETRAGAAGTIGADYVAKSAPDGYTLLYGVTGANSIAPSLYRKLPYDPEKDLAPISIAFAGPNVLLVNSEVSARTVQELVSLAKARPGQLSFASAGSGSMSHLNGEMLKAQTGADILHVPYKGGGAAAPDLIGGRVQMMIETGGSVFQLIRSGKVRPLAVTTPKRFPQLPDVPTFAELGFPSMVSVVWGGAFAPGGTPRPVLERVADAMARAAKDPAYRETVAGLSNDAVSMTPDEFRAFVHEEIVKYGELVRRLGLEAQ